MSPRFLMIVIGLICAWNVVSLGEEPKTRHVLWVMTDGLRWEELFSGADESLLSKERGGVANVEETKQVFWRETAEERRQTLLPFMWSVIAKEGQIFGNRHKKSDAKVTNGRNFSYPGYHEVLCGYPDIWVNSNDKIYNRNVTVLEWLHAKPAFKGKIAAYTSWDVFPFIINAPRCGIPVNSGYAPVTETKSTPEIELLNRLMAETQLAGEGTRADAFTFHAAMQYLKAEKPRVLFVSFDETDAQGHAGRYDRLLASARKIDDYIKQLWETMQEMPEYKGTTTLVITTDHGRGEPPETWKSHSILIPGSAFIWAAFLGPDTAPLGERENVPLITQDQIAATVARLLGEDYAGEVHRAGKPILDVLPGKPDPTAVAY